MEAEVVTLLLALQQQYITQEEWRDNWSDMLFSASFLAPVLRSMREQMYRAFIFARPGERLEPADPQAVFDIVLRAAAKGPKYLGIKTREQAHVCIVRGLLNEYVYPWRYARKNSFAAGRREVMIRPPPGVFQSRNQDSSVTDRMPIATCDGGERARLIKTQKARFRTLGYY